MPVWASSGALCEPVQGSEPCLRCLGGCRGLWSSALSMQERSGSPWFQENSSVLREVPNLPGHILPGEGLCCEPVRASRGLCHPGVSESVRGVGWFAKLPANRVARAANNALGLEHSEPPVPSAFFLIPVVNSDRGAPAMSALPAATGWKLEMLSFVLHTWFCCSVLLLLLEMNSSLLSVSPFHKKAWLRAN